MNRAEVARLLGVVATIDKRTIGESDITAWHLLLAPVDYERAQDAVVAHFRRKPGVWLEAGHIWTLACTRTDGEYEETAARQAALEAGREQTCEQGTHCPQCRGVHGAAEACNILARRPADHAKVIEMFKPEAITAPAQVAPAVRPYIDDAAAESMESERRRQLAALGRMTGTSG